MAADRPGGWVEGIGWVALLGDVPDGATIIEWGDDPYALNGDHDCIGLLDEPVIVTRWADGSTPEPPTAPDPGKHGDGNRWCTCDPDWWPRSRSDPTCPLDYIAEFAATLTPESPNRLPDVTELPEWQKVKRLSRGWSPDRDLDRAVTALVAAVDSRGEN